jgi:hypothetical protein
LFALTIVCADVKLMLLTAIKDESDVVAVICRSSWSASVIVKAIALIVVSSLVG